MTRAALALALLAGPALAQPAPAPRPWCAGPVHLADADSGEVRGCCRYRLPDIDQVERGASCYAPIVAEARAAFQGRIARIDCAGPTDRHGRVVTDARVGDDGLRAAALARGWAVACRYDARRGRWIDPAPACPDWSQARWVEPAEMACDDPWRDDRARTAPCGGAE